MRNLHFEASNLLFEKLFLNSLLSWHNRVHQVYVPRELIPRILYRRRKLGLMVAGFAGPKTFWVDIVFNNVRY